MSDAIDWAAVATMLEREDSGSDLDMNFKTLATAPLGALVQSFVGMDASARARIIIDRGAAGTIAYADIMALASRADFPGE